MPALFFRAQRDCLSLVVCSQAMSQISPRALLTSLPVVDFRMIPMGDIYLHHGVGVVMRSKGTHWARRLHSARIVGKKTDMTVAMYQGDNAEQKWREDLAKYLWLRHPNFLQLYGAASSPGIHAIILHDDLIPVDAFDYP
ncbi:hypothetical protein B0H11DRAFT_2275638 [Mycena galericulata]|nr:hypothetical protein B0H11DRAFT_2275638 [Mycena galericulata]